MQLVAMQLEINHFWSLIACVHVIINIVLMRPITVTIMLMFTAEGFTTSVLLWSSPLPDAEGLSLP